MDPSDPRRIARPARRLLSAFALALLASCSEVGRTREPCLNLADVDYGTISYNARVMALPPGAKPSGPDPCLEDSHLREPPGTLNYEFGCEFTGADGVRYRIMGNSVLTKTLPVVGRPASDLPLGLKSSDDLDAVQARLERRGLKVSREPENGETELLAHFCDKESLSWPAFIFDGQGRFLRIELQAMI